MFRVQYYTRNTISNLPNVKRKKLFNKGMNCRNYSSPAFEAS